MANYLSNTPWFIQSGTWKVVGENFTGGLEKLFYCVSDGTLSAKSSITYGTWKFKLKIKTQGIGSTVVSFISTEKTYSTTGNNGYAIYYQDSDNRLVLCRVVNGSLSTVVGYCNEIPVDEYYDISITRRYDGLFKVYLKGGSLNNWTLVITGTDNTYTSSRYFSSTLIAEESISGFKFYSGLISNNNQLSTTISWQTDVQVQSLELKVKTGENCLVDWGNGTRELLTGNDGWQAFTLDYGSPGTRNVNFYVVPGSLRYFYYFEMGMTGAFPSGLYGCKNLEYMSIKYKPSAGGMTGSFPDLTSFPVLRTAYLKYNAFTGPMSNLPSTLVNFSIEDNPGITGGLPDFSDNAVLNNVVASECALTEITDLSGAVSLAYLYLENNSITTYSSTEVPLTLNNINFSGNALDQTSIDLFLTQLITNAASRPSSGTANLSGGTNASPTSSVLSAAQAALPGWTITTN